MLADLKGLKMPTERMAPTVRKGWEFLAEAVFTGPPSSPVYGKKGTMVGELTGQLGFYLPSTIEKPHVTHFVFTTEFPLEVKRLDQIRKNLSMKTKMFKQKEAEQQPP